MLDAAAITLANAGSGHYRPALEDGAAVRGCGKFRIAFKLRGDAGLPVNDPRFPTIGARIVKLNDEMIRRMQERINEFGRPLSVDVVILSGGPVAERTIRQYARSCARPCVLCRMVSLLRDCLTGGQRAQMRPLPNHFFALLSIRRCAREPTRRDRRRYVARGGAHEGRGDCRRLLRLP